mmetsp:Transcript_24218/g.70079  ORF Transcript_24218/g.70079 Transcript_24218/m.70079 type:complete len:356 (-) Transcript_24218:153-1220(-)|eukprot:CAMPEP_0170284666 /NCGR_PEP_ID=MMETSP0116_2-20130129/42372_1 /TAXON_ID=400756 /ORGANISM="Durinskia baltica, Strain CSIRO CS-38" /LENGTH=355 /DNA_ID=CAMNT_0010536047 /DNA_START=82 /DNA_END=1149 /DNA_ORIENTATION=-
MQNIPGSPLSAHGGVGGISPEMSPTSVRDRRTIGAQQHFLFKTKICTLWEQGICSRRHCRFAHGAHELRKQPSFEQTSMCRFQGACNDPDCRYAHSVEELRPRAMSPEDPSGILWARSGRAEDIESAPEVYDRKFGHHSTSLTYSGNGKVAMLMSEDFECSGFFRQTSSSFSRQTTAVPEALPFSRQCTEMFERCGWSRQTTSMSRTATASTDASVAGGFSREFFATNDDFEPNGFSEQAVDADKKGHAAGSPSSQRTDNGGDATKSAGAVVDHAKATACAQLPLQPPERLGASVMAMPIAFQQSVPWLPVFEQRGSTKAQCDPATSFAQAMTQQLLRQQCARMLEAAMPDRYED